MADKPEDILQEKDAAKEGDVTSEVVKNNPYHVIYEKVKGSERLPSDTSSTPIQVTS